MAADRTLCRHRAAPWETVQSEPCEGRPPWLSRHCPRRPADPAYHWRFPLMRKRHVVTFGIAVALALGGCATPPQGPSVAVMPAPNKPFDQFQADQATCKQ